MPLVPFYDPRHPNLKSKVVAYGGEGKIGREKERRDTGGSREGERESRRIKKRSRWRYDSPFLSFFIRRLFCSFPVDFGARGFWEFLECRPLIVV